MDNRPEPEEVTAGLTTTAAKIRALAEAGYYQAEIHKLLNVRYPDIREVLIDAGLNTRFAIGFPSTVRKGNRVGEWVVVERDPILVDTPLPAPDDASWEILLRAGFEFIGEWTAEPESGIKLDVIAPIEPGVYSFVVNDLVMYVGLTNNSLRTRLDQYGIGRLGYRTHRTDVLVMNLIARALSNGERVKIVFAMPKPLEWHGLPVSTAAGLEVALVQKIRPAWIIKAGYSPEIHKLFLARYRHMRKELLDDLNTLVERDPILVDATLPARDDASWEILLLAGFEFIGEWMAEPESGINFDVKEAPMEPGVYSFVVNDLVMYVGLTSKSLRTRLDQYRIGDFTHRTNSMVKNLIASALSNGERVKILFAMPEPLECHGLPASTAAGLETGLIQKIRPAWNIMAS
jgi:hypothetical protein